MSRVLIAAASLGMSVLVASRAAAVSDHLKCYKIKDPQAKVKYTATLDGLTVETGCTIKVPGKLLCVPAEKSSVTPTPPGGGGTGEPNRFVCYKVKCPKATVPPLAVSDQFGTRSVTPGTTKYLCAPVAGPTTTTTTATTTSTTLTTLPPPCCAPSRITRSSGAGMLQVGTLPAFPFPAGVTEVLDLGAAAGFPNCSHAVIIPAGGFTVPVFCIPTLGFTSKVTATGCESGGADGQGTVWDAVGSCADADVSRVGDTSDPDGGGPSCGTLGVGCNTSGAGNDTNGNVNTTRGNGACDAPGMHIQLDIPVNSTTWNDVDGNCPDDDLQFDPGTDTFVSDFDFILSPTSATSNADYTDLNGDSCSVAGGGPDHTKHCSLDASRPCVSNSSCTSPPAGTCVDGPLVGTPMPGPCCTVGQTATMVATGFGFTGGGPLFDITFSNSTPDTVTACGVPTGGSCVLTTDPCKD
jgi:hypothetical protein